MKKVIELIKILILSIISIVGILNINPPDIMEARNFITAREMVEKGNWFVTTLNGKYRFEKPPLPTWLTAIVMKIFNNISDEWLLRIPVVLITILLIIYIYKFIILILNDEKLALIVTFIVSTNFMILKIGSRNSWDMYPYVFIFIAIYYFIAIYIRDKWKDSLLFGLFLAFSLMSKGPIGLYGLFLPFLIAYGFIYRFKNWKEYSLKLIVGVVFGIALASIWPLGMYLENKELFLKVMAKEGHTWNNKHVKSIFFYLNYIGYMGIWAIFSIVTFFKGKNIECEKKRKFLKFINIWTILVLIFLSIVKMKKERYGLPLYIVSSISVGMIFEYYLNYSWEKLKRYDKAILYIQLILSIIVSIIAIGLVIWSKSYSFKHIIVIVLLLIYLFYSMIVLKNKDRLKRWILYSSGLLMVVGNIGIVDIIETKIRGKNLKEYSYLESLQKKELNYAVYSDDYVIDDVWSVGKNILEYNENIKLPEKFYFLTTDDIVIKGYKVISKKIYYRYRNDDDTIIMYLFEKE